MLDRIAACASESLSPLDGPLNGIVVWDLFVVEDLAPARR